MRKVVGFKHSAGRGTSKWSSHPSGTNVLDQTVGDEVISAGAGVFAYGPPQVPHTFVVDGDEGARFLLVAQPAGFEGFIRELSVPATSLTLPPASVALPSPPEMMAVATKYGIEILGPPPGLDG